MELVVNYKTKNKIKKMHTTTTTNTTKKERNREQRYLNKVYTRELEKHQEDIKLEYGFLANPNLCARDNFNLYLQSLSTNELQALGCLNRSCHNLCKEQTLPPATIRVLGLNLKFGLCLQPAPQDGSDIDFQRLRNDIRTKFHFLSTENDTNLDDWNPKLHIPSTWKPPAASEQVETALSNFENAIKLAITTNPKQEAFSPNLTRHEQRLLKNLRDNKDVIILPTDKNLGPAAMDTADYVQQVLQEHLLTTNYEIIHETTALRRMTLAAQDMWEIFSDLHETGRLEDQEATFLQRSFQMKQRGQFRMAHFYGTPKVHKNPIKLRPVVSKCGTELEVMSKYLDSILQRIVKYAHRQRKADPTNPTPILPSYLKDSWELLDDVKQLPILPPDARLISIDAVGMYVNIDTDTAIDVIGSWYDKHWETFNKMGLPNTDFILRGLILVMKNCIFQFDDLFCHQQNGTAMGTSVACMYATIFMGAYEEDYIHPNLNNHGIFYYRRFIDDGFAVIRDQDDNVTNFMNLVNTLGPEGKRLQWTTSGPKMALEFLDLRLQISAGKIISSSYSKEMNLHLYLPAHSAHPASNIAGMIYGKLRTFWLQNTSPDDYIKFTRAFYDYMHQRGHTQESLNKLFMTAAKKLQIEAHRTRTPNATERRAFLHVRYHPYQTPRDEIQRIFQDTLATTLKTAHHEHDKCARLGIQRMVIAQSRAPNLRDKVCRSTLDLPTGIRASDMLQAIANEHG